MIYNMICWLLRVAGTFNWSAIVRKVDGRVAPCRRACSSSCYLLSRLWYNFFPSARVFAKGDIGGEGNFSFQVFTSFHIC